VQSNALVILRYLDDLEKAKSDVQSFKLVMSTRDEFDPQLMFPEYFKKEDSKEREESQGSGHPDAIPLDDLKNVDWVSPKDGDDWERMKKLLEQGGKGFLNGGDLIGSQTDGGNPITWTEWR
jgi:hypothetical protein